MAAAILFSASLVQTIHRMEQSGPCVAVHTKIRMEDLGCSVEVHTKIRIADM